MNSDKPITSPSVQRRWLASAIAASADGSVLAALPFVRGQRRSAVKSTLAAPVQPKARMAAASTIAAR